MEDVWLFSESSNSLNDQLLWENLFSRIFFRKILYWLWRQNAFSMNADVIDNFITKFTVLSFFFCICHVGGVTITPFRSPILRQNLKKNCIYLIYSVTKQVLEFTPENSKNINYFIFNFIKFTKAWVFIIFWVYKLCFFKA